jgi:hypothetical protein
MSPDDEPARIPALGPPDWPSQLANRLESTVGVVRDRAVRPATLVVRAVVLGVFAALLAALVVVLLTVTLVRVLDSYVFPGRMWATYTLIGGIFVISGGFLWSIRRSRS